MRRAGLGAWRCYTRRSPVLRKEGYRFPSRSIETTRAGHCSKGSEISPHPCEIVQPEHKLVSAESPEMVQSEVVLRAGSPLLSHSRRLSRGPSPAEANLISAAQ